ncbi:hypothetical protein [Nonomuraea glycinis]|uniref:hypothetical protein n=1 Tax=Nonomuraea glycinis TaxID=2047744 RepID=UPI002E120D00|nr:hypothetical protein OHA68_09300 [Nonomuraea glycinis]
MSQQSFSIGHRVQRGTAAFDELGNTIWLATETGDVVTFRLYDQAAKVLGGGYQNPVAVLPQRDGLNVAVVESSGTILLAARTAASRQDARVVADLGRTITAAAQMPDAAGVLAVGDGMAVTIDLTNGSITTLTSGLTKPSAVVVDEQRRRAVVVDHKPEGARLQMLNLDSGLLTERGGAPLDEAVAITTAPAGTDGVFVAAEPSGTVTLVRLDANAEEPGPDLGSPVYGLARWGSLVLLVTDTEIVAHEWGLQLGPMEMSIPIGPVFVGGYIRATADLDGQGLKLEEVEFAVEEGIDAGFVSAGIEPPEPDGRSPIVVGAGHMPGEYHLVARRMTDGQELARRRFRVTSHWPDDKRGPAVVVTGEAPVVVSRAWGDGSHDGAPIPPVRSDWRVAMVLVDTDLQRYTTADAQSARTDCTNFLLGGGDSARRYYEEVSFGKTTVSLVGNQVFGPINLLGGWGHYFVPRKGPWGGWMREPHTMQECANAFSTEMRRQAIEDHGDPSWATNILRSIDALVFVFPTADPTTTPTTIAPARFAWGQAEMDQPPQVWWKDEFSTTSHPVPAVIMPVRRPAGDPGSPSHNPWKFEATLTHELGHTLGLRDTYDKGYPAEVVMDRLMNDFDMMGQNIKQWPHLSLAHRRRLGWINPAWIKTFNFGLAPVGGTVNLHALASLSADWVPPGGNHCAGIEVPIRGSRDYYFEYRAEQAGQMGDQKLEESERGATRLVLGCDVDFDPAATPWRPHIMLLPKDADTEGPILIAAGEDYEETDTSDVPSNGSAHDFRLVLDNTPTGNTTQVTVHYISAERPQLHIAPAPGRNGNWKSPDINVTGPMGRNFLTGGRNHTIEVTVHNLGNLAANKVQIRVAWLPFTTSPGAWVQLPPPAPQDIPANGRVVFPVSWNVPTTVGGVPAWHFCVRADVTAYVDPTDPAHSEIVVHDNWAQSNFDRVFSFIGSPSSRRRTGVDITNSLADPAIYRTVANQSSAFFRTYIGNAWLHLEPGETHRTEFMYESLAGDPIHDAAFMDAFSISEGEGLSNVASLTTSVVGPGDDCAVAHQWWGARLIVTAGFVTRIEDLRATSDGVTGTVIATAYGVDQIVTTGDVNMVFWSAGHPEETITAGSWSGGQFWVNPPSHIWDALRRGEEVYGEAFYVSRGYWASCRSGAHRLILE